VLLVIWATARIGRATSANAIIFFAYFIKHLGFSFLTGESDRILHQKFEKVHGDNLNPDETI
jgi:hypothetical protein